MNEHMRLDALLHRVVIAIVGVAVFGCSVSLGAGPQDTTGQSRTAAAEQRRAEIIEKVKQAPQVPTRFVNPNQAPLTILDSSSKEISSAEYSDLVGLTAVADRIASFPDVKIVNNTGKRVTAFMLILKNEKTNQMHAIKASGIKVEPYTEYLVEAPRWVRPDKQAGATKDEAHTSMKIQRTPGFDSERMWHLGKASDLVVRVGLVEFEDGSRWMMEEPSDSPTVPGARLSRAGYFSPIRSSRSLVARPARNVLFSCTCSCGVTCHSGGGYDCSADGGSCNRYEEFINCVNNCCAAAAAYECRRGPGGILP